MNYYKYQKILGLLSFLAFLYVCFFYYQNSKLENFGKLELFEVINQGCRNSKGTSSVHISYNRKTYFIRLANGECYKYPVGSKITLIYNDYFDYFYFPNSLSRDRYRLIFTFSLFFFSILPWKIVLENWIIKKKRR